MKTRKLNLNENAITEDECNWRENGMCSVGTALVAASAEVNIFALTSGVLVIYNHC
jgi:hypothetical protein